MSGKLLLFLSDSPFQHESVDNAIEISEAALEKGHEVNIFLMMDGVYNPVNSQNGEPFQMTPGLPPSAMHMTGHLYRFRPLSGNSISAPSECHAVNDAAEPMIAGRSYGLSLVSWLRM